MSDTRRDQEHAQTLRKMAGTFRMIAQAGSEPALMLRVEAIEAGATALERTEGSAQEEIARLREALGKFGQHKATCAVLGGYQYGCTCGFRAALTDIPTASGQE